MKRYQVVALSIIQSEHHLTLYAHYYRITRSNSALPININGKSANHVAATQLHKKRQTEEKLLLMPEGSEVRMDTFEGIGKVT